MMSKSHLLVLSIAVLASTACTRMPEEYRTSQSASAVPAIATQMLDAVASAPVGTSIVYTDQTTGLASEITVESEYFSANGRICRRYTERPAAAVTAYPGLSCNAGNGWVKVPVADFAG